MHKGNPFGSKRGLHPVLLAASLLVLLVLAASLDTESLARWPVLCPFRRYLGVRCAGCGLTRGVVEAVHGRFAEALSQNVLVVLAFPMLFGGASWGSWFLVQCLAGLFKKREAYSAVTCGWLIASVILGASATPALLPRPDRPLHPGFWSAIASEQNRAAIPLCLFSISNLVVSPACVAVGRRRSEKPTS